MNRLPTCLIVALCLALPAFAATQEARTELRLPDTVEGWLVVEDALPEGVTLSDELVTNSAEAWQFFDDPGTGGTVPAPVKKVSQTLVTPNPVPVGDPMRGALMAFEYDGDVPGDVAALLPGLLWGEDGEPTALHPENFVVEGRYVVVLSFALEDPTGDWLRGDLRKRVGVNIPRTWISLGPLMAQAIGAMQAQDFGGGLQALETRADDIEDYALAQYLMGDLAVRRSKWPLAEKSYARALELHEQGIDPLPGGKLTQWVVLDGWGYALIAQGGKDEEGIKVLERAVELAKTLEEADAPARSGYNLACGYARLERFEEAHATLSACIEVVPDYQAMARDDEDFAVARERDDFKELLEL